MSIHTVSHVHSLPALCGPAVLLVLSLMSASCVSSSLLALQQVLDSMPPVRAMQIRVRDYRDGCLRLAAPLAANVNDKGNAFGLAAPLAANVNDKGNAFGGSLASALTLSGWALVTLQLRLAGHDAEVYVADSHLRYLSPVHEDLAAQAQAAPDADWATFLSTFAQRRKARIAVVATQPGVDGRPAAELSGRFVAFARG